MARNDNFLLNCRYVAARENELIDGKQFARPKRVPVTRIAAAG